MGDEGEFDEDKSDEVKVGDEVMEQVDEMKYLAVMIISDGSIEKEVEARI